ncbi:MAG: ribose-5-phosphate isomerase RpiA [Hyphomonadaceae bacterium]|nr:ribose-5-phosphate isomerase RpiA [Hyphomonadaceae bacterium]MBC6412491.1 ribose-5-phosphate isomerase RpiA [Hyphomonadaceae bacterium]
MSRQKENAALAALDFVEDGMTLGLGSGSAAEIFVKKLGERVAGGLEVRGVPTSRATARCADENGVPLVNVDRISKIHVTIDGADEVDPMFSLIKGGGACLLREKIIANASDRMVVIVDNSKMVDHLGAFPLPIEVDPFGMTLTADQIYRVLKNTGCPDGQAVLRENADKSGPLITEGGHCILDCRCGKIPDPAETAHCLDRIPGIMEHGLFLNLASVVIVGEDDHARVMELSREQL